MSAELPPVNFLKTADLLEDIRVKLEAEVGRKAQGQSADRKMHVQRHGHAPKRSYNAAEKAAETRVRQAGKKAAKERE